MNRNTLISLLIFVFIGALLRAYHIGFQCPWVEEQYTLWIIGMDWSSMFATSVFSDFNPPLYYALAKVFSTIIPAWWAIRIPSLIAGVAMIPAMYLLGREYKDESTGVWCAGIASILFPLVYYSQYGRAYALLYLFFTIFLVFYLKEKNGEHGYWFWVAGVLCVWTHLFSVIPVVILIADVLLFGSELSETTTKSPIVGFVSIFLLLAGPLILLMLPSVSTGRTIGTGYGDSQLVLLLTTPGEFFGVLFVVLGIFLLIAIITEYRSAGDNYNPFAVMFIAAVVTIVAGFMLANSTPVFPRYYSATAGVIFLLFAARGVSYAADLIWTISGGSFDIRDGPETEFAVPNTPVVAIAVCLVLMLLQAGDFSSYYSVQKYVCDIIPAFTSLT